MSRKYGSEAVLCGSKESNATLLRPLLHRKNMCDMEIPDSPITPGPAAQELIEKHLV